MSIFGLKRELAFLLEFLAADVKVFFRGVLLFDRVHNQHKILELKFPDLGQVLRDFGVKEKYEAYHRELVLLLDLRLLQDLQLFHSPILREYLPEVRPHFFPGPDPDEESAAVVVLFEVLKLAPFLDWLDAKLIADDLHRPNSQKFVQMSLVPELYESVARPRVVRDGHLQDTRDNGRQRGEQIKVLTLVRGDVACDERCELYAHLECTSSFEFNSKVSAQINNLTL